MSDSSSDNDGNGGGGGRMTMNERNKIKSAVDLQRKQLDKLMQNPEREVIIPELKDSKKPRAFNPHEFVRNVMGKLYEQQVNNMRSWLLGGVFNSWMTRLRLLRWSLERVGASAGAGSGEFDIYRGCRRRESIRQEFLQVESDKKKAADEFEQKRLANLKAAELRTAKRRAKRLKQKQKGQNRTNNKNNDDSDQDSRSSQEEAANDDEIEIDLNEKESTAEVATTDAQVESVTTATQGEEKAAETAAPQEIAASTLSSTADSKTHEVSGKSTVDAI